MKNYIKTHKKLTVFMIAVVSFVIGASIALAAAGDTIFNGRLIVTNSYAAVNPNVALSPGELYVKGDIEADGNLNVAGTSTCSGFDLTNGETITNAVDGVIKLLGVGGANNEGFTFDLETTANAVELGTTTGITVIDTNTLDIRTDIISGRRPNIADNVAITPTVPDECGAIIYSSTDNTVVTLPNAAAANLGCCFTLSNVGADAAAKISFSPHSSDGIDGSCIGEGPAFVEFSGTADKDIINTKATANKGDSATVCSDGTAGWYVTSCLGVWASE